MSEISKTLPENAPFGHQQQVALNALLPTVTPQQATWLSGYFAAIGLNGSAVGTEAAPAPQAATAAPAAAAPTVPLTVLYGSESGNSEGCAEQLGLKAKEAGFKVKVADMGDYDPTKLGEEKNLLVVVSTWGEGDPPERAVPFHEFVHSNNAPSLKDTNFAVFALGDTSYADFCECGKQFDKRFEELGGKRLMERVDVDVDFEEPFKEWMNAVVPRFVDVAGVKEAAPAVPAVSVSEAVPAAVAAPVAESYGKKNPFPSLVKEKINLNGRGSAKETYHIEFDLEGSGFSYEPGDVVGLFPRNCPEVVDDFVRLAGFRGDEIVEQEESVYSLSELLEERHDITSLNANLMKKYAPFAKNKQLDDFLQPEKKAELTDWIWGREIRDLFMEYPPSDQLTPEQLLGMLRKMPPRLYSIASSLRAHPNEVHLTVGVVRYNTHGRERKGVCSSFLGDRLEVGETAPVYVHHNKNFFLPEDSDTPIIMVGPGTGIAPFRAFVEDRAATGAKGLNWLFFGDQHFNTDFLYQTEWQKYLKSGMLSRMDVAFSRDTDRKVYVQHRMKENARDIYAWIEEGAYFYVCGDASRMAKDVNQALIEIGVEQGGKSQEDAEAWVKDLQKKKRYQRDVY